MNRLLFYCSCQVTACYREREGAGSDFSDFLPPLIRRYFCNIWRGSAPLVCASPAFASQQRKALRLWQHCFVVVFNSVPFWLRGMVAIILTSFLLLLSVQKKKKMLAADLTVASVVKVKSQFLWHWQSLRGCFLGNECPGGLEGIGRGTDVRWTCILTLHRSDPWSLSLCPTKPGS